VLTIGVDIGGSSVRAGLVDGSDLVLETCEAPTPRNAQALEDVITTLVAALGGAGAVGLAVAGFVSADRRRVGFSPHLPWRDAPVAERIGRRTGMPVLLEHDANAAVVAEHRCGAAVGATVAVLVSLGTGIGGALLLDGKLFRGAHGVAPELGHLRLVPGGRACPCGKRGCWERYCSGTALATTARELLERHGADGSTLGEVDALTGYRVAAAAAEGDLVALAAVADVADWLGEGLALVADLYDPEVVVVGGGLSRSAPLFLERAVRHYAAIVTGAGHRPLASVRAALLGEDSGIVGAALLSRTLVS